MIKEDIDTRLFFFIMLMIITEPVTNKFYSFLLITYSIIIVTSQTYATKTVKSV